MLFSPSSAGRIPSGKVGLKGFNKLTGESIYMVLTTTLTI
ncbi:hypothetical protein AWRI1631_101530 [Saccharomyces cerevisiae AWRI1631]|uniref:Uncharacterized protein n=1 Tax=Saccharomyces cerevisiae (strain AWRI1631) TaxID=545124 RepID=B5VLC7_YEAS6|nr:hypothetical protein AWRI1631_101530 [Saccharomyces cerevisiae AWRI1631]